MSNLVAVLREEGQVITGMLAEILGADGLIVIAVVVIVLLFGGTKLPKLARGLGSASHEFKKGMEEGDKEGEKDGDKTSGPVQSN